MCVCVCVCPLSALPTTPCTETPGKAVSKGPGARGPPSVLSRRPAAAKRTPTAGRFPDRPSCGAFHHDSLNTPPPPAPLLSLSQDLNQVLLEVADLTRRPERRPVPPGGTPVPIVSLMTACWSTCDPPTPPTRAQ